MIPLTDLGWQDQPWQWQLANAVTDISDLVSMLDLETSQPVTTDFPLLVPLPYLSRIERGNPDDPLLRQVMPLAAELGEQSGFVRDPLSEAHHTPTRGVLHKYQGRVLVIVSGACAVNCRYCFRRHFPYQDVQPDAAAWQDIIAYVAKDDSITEVILSGGDPLVLSDRRLAWLGEAISAIPHVRTIRFHTRLPIVIPQRVTAEFAGWIASTRLSVVVVVHANHANEIDKGVAGAVLRLREAGATVLNQSVLLRGVNDHADALTALSQRLFACGVMPYYLHLLDPVAGAAHFDVPTDEGRKLIREVAARLPGYLVPRLVREVPGEPSKSPRSFDML